MLLNRPPMPRWKKMLCDILDISLVLAMIVSGVWWFFYNVAEKGLK